MSRGQVPCTHSTKLQSSRHSITCTVVSSSTLLNTRLKGKVGGGDVCWNLFLYLWIVMSIFGMRRLQRLAIAGVESCKSSSSALVLCDVVRSVTRLYHPVTSTFQTSNAGFFVRISFVATWSDAAVESCSEQHLLCATISRSGVDSSWETHFLLFQRMLVVHLAHADSTSAMKPGRDCTERYIIKLILRLCDAIKRTRAQILI